MSAGLDLGMGIMTPFFQADGTLRSLTDALNITVSRKAKTSARLRYMTLGIPSCPGDFLGETQASSLASLSFLDFIVEKL